MGRVGGLMVREGWRRLWNSYTRNLIGFDEGVVRYSKNGTLWVLLWFTGLGDTVVDDRRSSLSWVCVGEIVVGLKL